MKTIQLLQEIEATRKKNWYLVRFTPRFDGQMNAIMAEIEDAYGPEDVPDADARLYLDQVERVTKDNT